MGYKYENSGRGNRRGGNFEQTFEFDDIDLSDIFENFFSNFNVKLQEVKKATNKLKDTVNKRKAKRRKYKNRKRKREL